MSHLAFKSSHTESYVLYHWNVLRAALHLSLQEWPLLSRDVASLIVRGRAYLTGEDDMSTLLINQTGVHFLESNEKRLIVPLLCLGTPRRRFLPNVLPFDSDRTQKAETAQNQSDLQGLDNCAIIGLQYPR